MKNLKFLVVALFLGLAALNITSCGSGEKEPNPLADSLSAVNDGLNGQYRRKRTKSIS